MTQPSIEGLDYGHPRLRDMTSIDTTGTEELL
jgi:hypothetical protein